MKRFLMLDFKTVVVIYILLDLICAGAGMGVPFFCILLGFPLGWYITRKVIYDGEQPYQKYRILFKYSIIAALFTFLLMLIVWVTAILINIDSSADIQNFGHPYILYDPVSSFVGWLILMIIISPFLQLLTAIFAGFVTLKGYEKKLLHQDN